MDELIRALVAQADRLGCGCCGQIELEDFADDAKAMIQNYLDSYLTGGEA